MASFRYNAEMGLRGIAQSAWSFTRLALALICVGFFAFLLGRSSMRPSTGPSLGTSSTADPGLDQVINELSVGAVPFEQVIDEIRRSADLNIVVDWRAIEDSGIGRDRLITMRFRNVTVAEALRGLLEDAGGGAVRLGFRAEGNIIRISTFDVLAQDRVLRFYDVSEILGSRTQELERYAVDGWLQSNGGLRSVPPIQILESAQIELTTLLEQAVNATQWQMMGGPNSMCFFGKRLAIIADPSTQEDVSRTLELARTELRVSRPTTSPRDP